MGGGKPWSVGGALLGLSRIALEAGFGRAKSGSGGPGRPHNVCGILDPKRGILDPKLLRL
jgi:hypothetical protein